MKNIDAVQCKDSAIYQTLRDFGVVPDQCRTITITLDHVKAMTITYECIMPHDIDTTIAAAIKADLAH